MQASHLYQTAEQIGTTRDFEYFGQCCYGFYRLFTDTQSTVLTRPLTGTTMQSLGSSAYGFARNSALTMPTTLVAIWPLESFAYYQEIFDLFCTIIVHKTLTGTRQRGSLGR
jgi:hypothetical protein